MFWGGKVKPSTSPLPTTVPKPAFASPPRDYLLLSILTTIFCFWPTGVVAIWKAVESRQAVHSGNHTAAQVHAEMARKLSLLSVALGSLQIVVIVTVVLLQMYVFVQNYTAERLGA